MATIGKTNPHAKRLRRDATDAERRLWYHLRDRRLGGYKFRRQVTIGPFIADFACVDTKLILEADGGKHDAQGDARRTHYLRSRGWRVLRSWNNDVLSNTDGVLEIVLAACEERTEAEPSPCPLPHEGEGM